MKFWTFWCGRIQRWQKLGPFLQNEVIIFLLINFIINENHFLENNFWWLVKSSWKSESSHFLFSSISKRFIAVKFPLWDMYFSFFLLPYLHSRSSIGFFPLPRFSDLSSVLLFYNLILNRLWINKETLGLFLQNNFFINEMT